MAEPGRVSPGLRLPISGWRIEIGRGAGDRPALEVYTGSRLVDVCVATPVSVSVLRGAVRSRRGAIPWALAWGRLPPGVGEATVEFTGPARDPQPVRLPAAVIEGTYWVAEAAGEFSDVVVHAGPAVVSGRLHRDRARRRR